MNIQEAKDIRLVDFLAGFGYEPVIQRGNSVWYKSPFRAEKKASFKVDLHKELWYDFGLAMRVLIISFQCIHVLPINGAIILIYDVLRMDLPQRIRICPPITCQYSTA